MINFDQTLKEGQRLQDGRPGRERVIVLDTRFNPMGSTMPPYWRVVNEDNKRVTTIREEFLFGNRWSILD